MEAITSVPWLGTRRPGEFCTRHRPARGKPKTTVSITRSRYKRIRRVRERIDDRSPISADKLSTVISRWQGAPRSVRTTALAVVVVLTYGTAVHVMQLVASGFNPYPDLPGWLRVYFIALTVLDPLAAVLLARRRRSGVVLAVVVLVSDAAANGFANFFLDRAVGFTAGRVGHTVITMLAIGVCAAAPQLWRTASPLQRHR